MTERKLASVRIIKDIIPIEGADAIETVVVDGWKVVAKKGDFEINDPCVYFEIDSFLPIKDEFEFLRKSSYRNVVGLGEGFRLRTIKLRGQVSQGLVMPIETTGLLEYFVGMDMTKMLGVKKYDPPIPAQLAGQVRGNFPTSIIPKTDQERIQNCFDDLHPDMYEASLKLDGTSCTIFKYEDEIRVCSRNLELKVNDANAKNTLVKIAQSDMISLGLEGLDNIALQGELMGPSIQGNREKLPDHKFYVFDIFDIATQTYFSPHERRAFCDLHKLDHVPIINASAGLPFSVDMALESVDGLKSINHPVAEGVVYKSNFDPARSFKVISNRFLMKEKD